MPVAGDEVGERVDRQRALRLAQLDDLCVVRRQQLDEGIPGLPRDRAGNVDDQRHPRLDQAGRTEHRVGVVAGGVAPEQAGAVRVDRAVLDEAVERDAADGAGLRGVVAAGGHDVVAAAVAASDHEVHRLRTVARREREQRDAVVEPVRDQVQPAQPAVLRRGLERHRGREALPAQRHHRGRAHVRADLDEDGVGRRPEVARSQLGEPVRQCGHVAALAADEHASADARVVGRDEEDLVPDLDGDVGRDRCGGVEERLARLSLRPAQSHRQRGFGSGVRTGSTRSRRCSNAGGSDSRSPRCSSGSSVANPGPSVAISNSTPLGSRK